MEGVEEITFKIYADSPEEALAMKQAIVGFIGWFEQRGVKVRAGRVAEAINGWENNAIIRQQIIKYIGSYGC